MDSLFELAGGLGIAGTSILLAWAVARAAPKHHDRDEERRQMREERRRPEKEKR